MNPGLLTDFQRFCAERGWEERPTVGEWEMLRMRHPDREHPLLVHRRKRMELGLTTHGESARMQRQFERNWRENETT